jgi:predicted site-specific integrase-resolvase
MDTEKSQQTQSVGVGLAQRTAFSTAKTSADQQLGGRIVLYARVSTADQTIEHQKSQAEAAGYRAYPVSCTCKGIWLWGS